MVVFVFNLLNWMVLQPLMMALFLIPELEGGRSVSVGDALGFVMLAFGWAFILLFLLLYGWSAVCVWYMKRISCRGPWIMSMLMVLPYTVLLLLAKGFPTFLVAGWMANGVCFAAMLWVLALRDKRNAKRAK